MRRMPLSDEVIAEIRAMHEDDERGYHGWSHPVDMLETMRPIRLLLKDPTAVIVATVTHDVIYVAGATDNEERSAVFAETRLKGIVADTSLTRAARMVRATADHRVPSGLSDDDRLDMEHFLDLDLSILAAEQAKFDGYEAGIRHEHRRVPWPAFAERRAGILEQFLERDFIYMTDWGRTTMEAQARRNLRRSVAKLRQAA